MSLSRIKSLAKDSLIYGISGIISKMIAVFLVPVYTRIFMPADYGIINIINTTFLLIGLLAGCALDNAAARWYYDTEDINDRKKTFATWFWFQMVITLALALLLMGLSPFAFRYLLKVPVENDTWLIWFLPCVTLLTNILPGMIWNWLRLNRKPVATVIFTSSQSLLTVGLTIFFVIGLKWGIKGVYAALFLSNLVFSFVALFQIKSWISYTRFNIIRLKEMLHFSLPMIPAALAFWVLNATGSYFLLYYTDKAEVGLFSIGASLASVVSLFTGSFQQAWGPFAFSIINEPDAKKTYANVFLIFSTFGSMIILGMFLFAPEALKIFTTEQYYGAAWVASILSINMVLIALAYIAALGASIAKNTKPYSVGVMIGALLTVLFNVVLIPFLGKEGAAISMILAQIVTLAYIFYRSHQLYPVHYRFVTAISVLGFAVVFGVIARWTIPESAGPGNIFMIKLLVLLAFAGISGLILKKEIITLLYKLKTKNKYS